MTHGRIKLACAAALASILLGGCAPWSTYPPVETTARLTKPTFEPVPTVMAVAIKYAQEHYVPGQDLPINLPEGTPAEAYGKTFAHLGGGRPMQTAGEKAIHVTEVRTRGFDAQVDMIYPRADGLNQFVTLTLNRSVMENYRVKSTRPWQLRDVAAPPPHYVPPEMPEKAADEKADTSENK